MTNEQATPEGREALSAEAAFVVHVTAGGTDAPISLHGRVEHVVSGQSLRFASVSDLVRFMRNVLASVRL